MGVLRRVPVAVGLGLLAGLLFLMVVGQTLNAAGAGVPAVAAACVAVAAVAWRLLRSWPFAVALAVSSLAYLAFFAWTTSGWRTFAA